MIAMQNTEQTVLGYSSSLIRIISDYVHNG